MELPLPTHLSQPAHQAPTARLLLEHFRDDEVARRPRELRLTLREVVRHVESETLEALTLRTDRGEIAGRFHRANSTQPTRNVCVIYVGGAGGGLDGPAHGLYPALCDALGERGVAGLRIHYRAPNNLPECILDTLIAIAFLRGEGIERVALVGHSFGGAVVISAAAMSPEVAAVVPLSTQTYGADLAPRVAPRPMLLVHGKADRVLPYVCSELVYAAAKEPKEIKLYPRADHGLDDVRDEVISLLTTWLDEKL